MKDELMVSIIIANWNGEAILRDCLHSIYQKTQSVSFEIIVVDDCSTDRSVDLIRNEFPSVKIVLNEKNLGYAKSNNRAMPFVKGKYILLLNNDTVFQNDVLMEFTTYMDAHPEAGICGGVLLNSDGSLQHSFGRFPTISIELINLFGLYKFFPNYSLGITPKKIFSPTETDMIVGANLFIRTNLAITLGLYDPLFTAYSEDTDLCYRVKDNGYKVMFIPNSRIIHLFGFSYGNEATQEIEKAKKKLYLLLNGLHIFCSKHYSSVSTFFIFLFRRLSYFRAFVSNFLKYTFTLNRKFYTFFKLYFCMFFFKLEK
jgi:GT2 family glycosyltransferase